MYGNIEINSSNSKPSNSNKMSLEASNAYHYL
jgi:hypothetical protein